MARLSQVAAWLGLPAPKVDAEFARVHTDTRSLQAGDLFVALRGEHFDANDFLGQAQAAGAVAFIGQGPAAQAAVQAGQEGWVVPDTLAALAQLGVAWRGQFNLPLVAVTGSNGKTTVTQMLAAILRAWQGEATLVTQGNFNNEIGVPLTVLRLRPAHRAAVVELGMNHPGEIARLATVAQPTVALVNNAQREHLEFMGSVQAVAQENGAVLQALPMHGVAVFPADDAYAELWSAMAGARRISRFALEAGPGVDVWLRRAQWLGDAWQVTAATPAGEVAYRLPIAGAHNVKNSLAALTCALAAGAPLAAVAQGLGAFEAVKGRSRALARVLHGQPLTLVDDSYNANPDSVRAAIEVLAELPAPRLLVLGDMGEVGDQGPQFHAEAGAYAQQKNIQKLLCAGVLSAQAAMNFDNAEHFSETPALIARVLAELPQVHSVLVKGSRFMRMEQVVSAVQAATQPQGEPSPC
jgi:UDP-N-acetylmuramoyl-tripeptide--D-alanyl-D-alanine ligase